MSSSTASADKIPQFLQQNLKFMELLSTLPKQTRKPENLYQYQGFWYPSAIIAGIVSVQQQYQALPMDIIIGGAMKTGNTWLKALCFAIATRKMYHTEHPLLNNMPHELVPFLELLSSREDRNITNALHHNLVSTHLPHSSLPESILSSGCKIIYICREPKDTFVSLWYFIHRREDLIRNSAGSITKYEFVLDDEFDMFCQGKNQGGPYWEHVLGYHRASLDRPDKVLFLKYEKLKMDTLYYVKKLAAFMDLPFSFEEELEGMPGKIVELCSFKNLSDLEVNKSGKYNVEGRFQLGNDAFFRKGAIGDWKNHLAPEMAERIDRITEEKLQGSGFTFGLEQ